MLILDSFEIKNSDKIEKLITRLKNTPSKIKICIFVGIVLISSVYGPDTGSKKLPKDLVDSMASI